MNARIANVGAKYALHALEAASETSPSATRVFPQRFFAHAMEQYHLTRQSRLSPEQILAAAPRKAVYGNSEKKNGTARGALPDNEPANTV